MSKFKLGSSPRKANIFLWIIGIAILALLATGCIWLVLSRNDSNPDKQDEAQTESAKDKITDPKKPQEADNANLPDNSTSITTSEVPVSKELTLSINTIIQTEGTVSAEASIAGATEEGTCVFTYTTPGDRPVVSQVASSNYTCRSGVPEVQFSKLGKWNLQVIFYLNNSKAEANQSVTIN